jgi:tight adherence protein C
VSPTLLASVLAGCAAVCAVVAIRAARHTVVMPLIPAREPASGAASLPRPILLVSVPIVLLALVAPVVAAAAAVVAGVLAWRLPGWRRARADRRLRRSVDEGVPQLLDLLAVGSSAGLSAELSLRRAQPALRGPMAEELGRVLEAVDLGARMQDELAALAEHLDLADLRRAAAIVGRTERLGSSLAEATAELAATVRADRRARITERARTAPVKMLFPLVFLVLPAFLLLTVVPVLLTTVRSI